MQSQDSKVDQNSEELEKKLELSEAWRLLLGMEADEVHRVPTTPASAQEADAMNRVPTLSGDPWSSLVRANGIQVVDLQQIHMHTSQPPMNERDVEHVLDIIQEEH